MIDGDFLPVDIYKQGVFKMEAAVVGAILSLVGLGRRYSVPYDHSVLKSHAEALEFGLKGGVPAFVENTDRRLAGENDLIGKGILDVPFPESL